MYEILSQYIPNILVHIFTFTPYLDYINKLRCPDVVNCITLPPELPKPLLVNKKKLLHNVNILNSFHTFSINKFKYLLLIYIYSCI